MLPEADTDFLVTLPISRGSTAYFRWRPEAAEVDVHPAGKRKSRRLAELMLRRHGLPGGGTLILRTGLSEGKGHASSSADLVATVRAIADATGVTPTFRQIESMLATIEPSDGVMYPGVVAFAHREVRLIDRLGGVPKLTIVGVDEGGQVDTLAFNRRPKQFTRAHKREYLRLLDEITWALAAGDLAEVGRVSTRSAVLNQRLGPKVWLDDVIDLARSVGALGVAAAHSGTILGLMFADSDERYAEKVAAAGRVCRALAGTYWIDRSYAAGPTPVLSGASQKGAT
jgi:L-threonine kinase